MRDLKPGQYTISILDTSYLIAFLMLFVVGGAMAFVGIPFRPYMVLGMIMILLFTERIKVNRILFLYVLLLIEIVVSAALNKTSFLQLALFSRNLIFSFLIYFLVSRYMLKQESLSRLFKWCSILGLIQLPIVVLQKTFYNQVIPFSAQAISYWDIGSGTFFIKNDSSMSIFLIGLIIIYLFNKNVHDKYKYLKVTVYFLAIFAAGSRISQLSILAILAYYYARNMSLKTILILSFISLVAIIIFLTSPLFEDILNQMRIILHRVDFSNMTEYEMNKFQSGGYNRAAAVLYYMSQPFKWFGDGPSAYYDVITREHTLGNTGHIFTFYAEVGTIGLVLSYLISYEFCKAFSDQKLQRFLYFFAFGMLSVTSSIFTDAGILLAYLTLLCLQNINTEKEVTNVPG